LILNKVLDVVKVHVHAKFHQATCSGSKVIVSTEKTGTDAKNNTAITSADSKKNYRLPIASNGSQFQSYRAVSSNLFTFLSMITTELMNTAQEHIN